MDYDKETLREMLKESLRQKRAEMALIRLSVNEALKALKVIEASIQEARQALGYNKYNES